MRLHNFSFTHSFFFFLLPSQFFFSSIPFLLVLVVSLKLGIIWIIILAFVFKRMADYCILQDFCLFPHPLSQCLFLFLNFFSLLVFVYVSTRILASIQKVYRSFWKSRLYRVLLSRKILTLMEWSSLKLIVESLYAENAETKAKKKLKLVEWPTRAQNVLYTN